LCFYMSKELNFVDCSRCANWDDKTRYFKACEACHNTKKVIDPKDILCNLCGESARHLGTSNEQYPHGLEKTSVIGGYESYHLFDMTQYTFTFCEKCLRSLFNQCKIPPDTDHVSFPDTDPVSFHNTYEKVDYAKDQEMYEYRLWQDAGGHHQAYLDRKCNFVKDCPNRAEYTQLISSDFTEGCSCEEHKELWGYGNSKLTKFIPNILKPFL